MESFIRQVTENPKLVALAALLAGPIGLLVLCIYRLFFHPYAKHPGPLLAKLTSWYSVWHTYKGDLHTDVWKCHEKYGDVVRYAPNRIIVNTDAGLKGIYSHGANVCKSKSYLRISLIPGVHPTLGTIDNKAHGKLRRILNQGLSDSYIRNMDPEFRSITKVFAQGVGEPTDRFQTAVHGQKHAEIATAEGEKDGWSVPKNMAEWCDFFTFDLMSYLVFGASYNLLTKAEDHSIIDGVLGQMRRVSFLTQLPELEDMRLHKWLFPDARRRALAFSQKSKQIMEERQEKKKLVEAGEAPIDGPRDLFSKLLAAKDPDTGEGLSQKQLWAESNLLIIAGSDTSSTGMAAVFFYLSRNPAAYKRVVEEVRRVFPSPDDVGQGAELLSCTYLRACIHEALRLAPAASGAMWREALPGGLRIPGADKDIYIPAGLEVATGIWSLNHNSKFYPEPFAYRPERWMADEVPEEERAAAKAAFATFSVGPRNCVGKGLAMIEISLALAVVISGYDFRLAKSALGEVGVGKDEFAGQYQTFWAFTSMKNGPYIQFKPVRS